MRSAGVTRDDHHVLHVAGSEGLNLALDQRLAANVEKRLRNFRRQRQQPLALPCGQNDHTHET
jgi:hypothetical protein